MKARALIPDTRISAYQRVLHQRTDTLTHTLIHSDTCISVLYADTRISAYQLCIKYMYQRTDTYQWDLMRHPGSGVCTVSVYISVYQ